LQSRIKESRPFELSEYLMYWKKLKNFIKETVEKKNVSLAHKTKIHSFLTSFISPKQNQHYGSLTDSQRKKVRSWISILETRVLRNNKVLRNTNLPHSSNESDDDDYDIDEQELKQEISFLRCLKRKKENQWSERQVKKTKPSSHKRPLNLVVAADR